ncbi:MAG TPA: redoxin domain-containing protein [Thermoplasmata archaeon]|nr:redoxin domain-containing protein [Thermoplasmata archaeon]
MRPVRVGDTIPDLEADAYQKGEIRRVRLSDYRDRWLVLAFYPADFTFVCPTELRELARVHEAFLDSGAEILSVSTDTAYTHKAWHDTSEAVSEVRFPMLADPTGRICRAFGTYLEEEGLSLRATFIIDPEGVVRHMEIHDNSIGRSAGEILRRLQAAKFVAENPGVVCPASWQPGMDVLRPGVDLIGRI